MKRHTTNNRVSFLFEMKHIIFIALIIGLLFSIPLYVYADKPDKGIKGSLLGQQCDSIIESQTEFIDLQPIEPIVRNPLRPDYLWDVDDSWRYYAFGSMEAGETYTIEKHFIADGVGHLFEIHGAISKRQSVLISLTIPDLNFSYEQEMVLAGGFCLLGPQNIPDSWLVPIEGSNGGVGIKCTAIFTVTALTKVRTSAFFFGIHYPCQSMMDSICGGHDTGSWDDVLSWNPLWRLVSE